MIFNPDLTNHVQELIFGRKTKKLLHPCLLFNEISLKNSISQKHLRLTLDVKLNFVEHIKNITQISINPSKTIPTDYIQNIYQKSVRVCGCHLRPSIQLLLSWKTRIYSIQCLPGNNRNNKRNIIGKTLPRVRVRNTKIETLV